MPLYPPFGVTPFKGRVQRLEKGAQRQQRGQIRPTSGSYARIPINALIKTGGSNTNLSPNQAINLSTSSVHKIGSTPPNSVSGQFAYIAPAAGTSITWYWDGTGVSVPIVLHRSDGSNFTVPGGNIEVDGLSPSTTYYFLPFWNTTNVCNVGWVPGTTGVPQIAFVLADTTGASANFYIISQNMQNFEPLSGGFMSATTGNGATGGGGSGGDGGGFGHCVMAGTEIEALDDLPYTIAVHSEFNWLHLTAKHGKSLFCTVDHPLYHATRGRVQAQDLQAGDNVITDRGEQEIIEVKSHRRKCSKHEVKMSEGHLYWANGFLSHNVKIP